MISMSHYETCELADVAEFERAKNGVVYPAGCSTLQISATRGQLGFLEEPSTVESKDVVIIPRNDIVPRYFYMVLQAGLDEFMARYATGINVQEKEVAHFPIRLHNRETQIQLVSTWEVYSELEWVEEREIQTLKAMKNTTLSKMFI